MNHTHKTFDCLIVGGPDHSERVKLSCSNEDILHPVLVTGDGQTCTPFAFRRDMDGRQLWLLMHPDATGVQLREQLLRTEQLQERYKGPERRRSGLHLLPAAALACVE